MKGKFVWIDETVDEVYLVSAGIAAQDKSRDRVKISIHTVTGEIRTVYKNVMYSSMLIGKKESVLQWLGNILLYNLPSEPEWHARFAEYVMENVQMSFKLYPTLKGLYLVDLIDPTLFAIYLSMISKPHALEKHEKEQYEKATKTYIYHAIKDLTDKIYPVYQKFITKEIA